MERDHDMTEGSPSRLERTLWGAVLAGYTLDLRDLKKGRTKRETYFNLYLRRGEACSLAPVVQGLYFGGMDESIRPWLEFRYAPYIEFPPHDRIDLEAQDFSFVLVSSLRQLVQPGGSLMVIYGGEAHPFLSDTEKGLKGNFPPPTTPLGFCLWRTGCRWFKDWYFSEGWMEGGMKLQASYPLDEYLARKGEARTRTELSQFVLDFAGRDTSVSEDEALARARHILSSLDG